MRRLQRRHFVLAALATSSAGTAQAQGQKHWLIGTWVGRLEAARTYGDSSRTLTVTSVSPDGTSAIGVFDAGGIKTQPKITVAGDRVSFVLGTATTGGSFAFTRRGNELVGTRTDAGSGQQNHIKLVRQ